MCQDMHDAWQTAETVKTLRYGVGQQSACSQHGLVQSLLDAMSGTAAEPLRVQRIISAWLTIICALQFRQQIGGALAQARQACVDGCSDPFTPGPGETSISQSQLSAAARGVCTDPPCQLSVSGLSWGAAVGSRHALLGCQ